MLGKLYIDPLTENAKWLYLNLMTMMIQEKKTIMKVKMREPPLF